MPASSNLRVCASLYSVIIGLNEPKKVTKLPGEVNYQKYSTRDSASMANGDEDGVVHDLFSLLSSEDRNFLVRNNADQVNHTQKLIISDKVFIFMFVEIGEEKSRPKCSHFVWEY